MLGFEIFVHRLDVVPGMKEVEGNGDGMLARWMVNMDGLRWLDALVQEGKAYLHGTGGYPERYIVIARWIVPVLLQGIPKATSPVVIGDDYVMPANWSGKLELHHDLIATCAPDQLLCVEAWDQS